MMRIVKITFFLLFLSYPVITFALVKEIYPFNSPVQSKQFNRLTYQLRCLVCQNENLADSQSGFAKDVRRQIYRMVRQGQSNQTIKQYLVDRYGNFILYDPPFNFVTLLLWLSPVLFLLLGGWIFYVTAFRKKNKTPMR